MHVADRVLSSSCTFHARFDCALALSSIKLSFLGLSWVWSAQVLSGSPAFI